MTVVLLQRAKCKSQGAQRELSNGKTLLSASMSKTIHLSSLLFSIVDITAAKASSMYLQEEGKIKFP